MELLLEAQQQKTPSQAVLLAYVQIHPSLGLPSSNLEASDPFHLTSFALALLLAFRLDASYSRYMEARSLWGDVVCDARNLMRQVCCTRGLFVHSQTKYTFIFARIHESSQALYTLP